MASGRVRGRGDGWARGVLARGRGVGEGRPWGGCWVMRGAGAPLSRNDERACRWGHARAPSALRPGRVGTERRFCQKSKLCAVLCGALREVGGRCRDA